MVSFWSLPRELRNRIYRLHLVQDTTVSVADCEKTNKQDRWVAVPRHVPALLQVNGTLESEAAPIYFGENDFEIGDIDVLWSFLDSLWPRHLKMVRKVTCTWAGSRLRWYVGLRRYGGYGTTRENFMRLSRMKSLEHVSIRVNEEEMLKTLSIGREVRQHHVSGKDLTPQQQLSILRFPAMTGLLTLYRVENVRFIKSVDENGEEYGGPIPGGPLEDVVLSKINAKRSGSIRSGRKRRFRFLDLPAELRNRVYGLLLRIRGPIHPSDEEPTSAPKDQFGVKITEMIDHESALSILAVNKQIHEEAIGLFYNANSFVFYYPVQLNAFLLSLGTQRIRLLRDITIYYYNVECGGVKLPDITFPLLKQLHGLRRLRVLMTSRLDDRKTRRGWLFVPHSWLRNNSVDIKRANPVNIPGFRCLFELRGVLDIRVRDVEMEKKVEELKTLPDYPDFAASDCNRKILQLARAYEHFNVALHDAQTGKINHELLDNNFWHLKEVFPTVQDDSEDDQESGSVEEDPGEGVDESDDSGSEYED